MFAVHESFADAVDEHYDPALDAVEADRDPHNQATLLTRTLYATRLQPVRALLSMQATASLVVPFPAGVGEGDVSDKVYAIKRAYARSVSGFRLRQLMAKPVQVRRTWGPQFSLEFGQRTYTRARHQLLAPYYDSFALSLLRREPEMTPREKQITRQLGWHNALYNRRFQVAYSQTRPSQLWRAELITRADCSGSVAGGCAWAQILPHIDWRYTNTWTQVKLGQRVDGIRAAVPGDVILYGPPSHEALYLGNGLVWSFGSYPAKILPHDYRHDRHSIRRFLPL